MKNHTVSPEALECYRQSAEKLASLLHRNDDLLLGLVGLRELGAQADEAVETVRELPTLKHLRLGWELFEAMLEGDGLDPEALLLEAYPLELVGRARRALWG